MGSWPLNGKKGGNRKHSKIDTLPPEMKATVEEMIMDGSATYSDIVAYLEQQGYSLSVSSVCRYAQGYVENLQTLQIAQANFRNMLDELERDYETQKLQERTQKNLELRLMQSQINPHFLYNTLETISSIAAVKQVFVVCDICGKLGEIFRYSLGKNYGELVPLEQEMTHIKNYMFIQKIRYGDRLQVFYNIDVDAAHVHIPRFILQPIVENAISHGLSNLTSVGTLEVSAFEKKDRLYIEIEDDGEGMVREKVAEITRFINTAKPVEGKKNIGIRNVNQRIKLAYGEAYGITIRSAPYQGSRFTIQLPIMRKGEEDET